MMKFTEIKHKSRISTRPQTSHPTHINTPNCSAISTMSNTIDHFCPSTADVTGGFIISSPDTQIVRLEDRVRNCQSAHGKIKMLKSHLKSLKSSYNSEIQNQASLSISVSRTNKGISETRRGFLKLYEKKKAGALTLIARKKKDFWNIIKGKGSSQ